MEKLRLLVTKFCDRTCKGCCNKDWDLDGLETATKEDLMNFKEILITGGEPLLYARKVSQFIARVKINNPDCKVYVYTARTSSIADFVDILEVADGITLTLHEQKDLTSLLNLRLRINLSRYHWYFDKSLRLNVFENVNLTDFKLIGDDYWKIQENMVWIKNCPLPKNEVFKKLILK